MKVKLYIVTYKNEIELNNWCLKSLFESTFPFDNNVFIINNHSNFVLYDEYKDKVQVLHNVLRDDNNNGHLGQSWNHAITLGFKNLKDPDCDIVITVQNDTKFAYRWFDNVKKLLKKYEYICFGAGDQVQVFTPEHIKKVGLYDENFSNMAFHDHDYFIRCVLENFEHSSISDFHHGRLLNPSEANFLVQTETGDRRNLDYHTPIRKFYNLGLNLLANKYSYVPMGIEWNNLDIFKDIKIISPQYLSYPYFECDMYNLEDKGYIPYTKQTNNIIINQHSIEFQIFNYLKFSEHLYQVALKVCEELNINDEVLGVKLDTSGQIVWVELKETTFGFKSDLLWDKNCRKTLRQFVESNKNIE